jgi:indole-3-glycerol phosphate synthase
MPVSDSDFSRSDISSATSGSGSHASPGTSPDSTRPDSTNPHSARPDSSISRAANSGGASASPTLPGSSLSAASFSGPSLSGGDISHGDIPDVLARICADTRAETARRQATQPLAALKSKIKASRQKPRGFGQALTRALMEGKCGLIAEFKRQSPSGGPIAPDADPADVARAYQAGGAVCLSVLTDGPYFGGTLADLAAARAAVSLPVLRKDFILDPWQVFESRAAGADCILLIMAALGNAQARELEEVARALDLDVLVEVHDRAELDRALGLQSPLIGINNRNLHTMRTDLRTTIDLAEHVPPDRVLITESGIRDHTDRHRLAEIGAHCLLVGESLLRQPDLTAATRELMGDGLCP